MKFSGDGRLKEILNLELFSAGDELVTVGALMMAVVVMLLTLLVSKAVQMSVRRALQKRAMKGATSVQLLGRLVQYTIVLIGFVIALKTIGIDLSTLFAAGAIFAVGIGFAMQSIMQNFVSGVILLVEQSIKPGDILEVDGTIVKVESLGLRSTLARTRFDEEMIIPNSALVQSTVKNFTLTDSLFMVGASVGVAYKSELKEVRQILESAAASVLWRDPSRPPKILLDKFGSSSVDYRVLVWTTDPWKSPRYVSDLHEAVWWALKHAGVTIAFPQLDLHFGGDVQFRSHAESK